MQTQPNDFDRRIDEMLWCILKSERAGITEDDAKIYLRNDLKSGVIKSVHDGLRQQYNEYMAVDPEGAMDFLKRYPQMETVHAEWRRTQQGYEPISKYDLSNELRVSHFLSKYDPNLSLSSMVTLFPEQVHEINKESFIDVCRRYGRDFFKERGVYLTGDASIDEAFAEFDEEIYAEAEARMEAMMDLVEPESFDESASSSDISYEEVLF